MADQITPTIPIDSSLDPVDNFVNLVNQTNNTSFTAQDLKLSPLSIPDPSQPQNVVMTVDGLVRQGYRGTRDIHYRRVDLGVLQNLVGYFHLGKDETVDDIIGAIETKAGLVPLQVKIVETSFSVYDTITIVPVSDTNLLYYGQMKIKLLDSLPQTLVGAEGLVAGDQNAGFFGEIPASELITPVNLINQLDISSIINGGILTSDIVNTQSPWLKFAYQGKVEFISKQIIVSQIGCDDLVSNNLIDGSTTIQIGNDTFKVRLMYAVHSGNGDTVTSKINTDQYSGDGEWNTLFYPICTPDSDLSSVSPVFGSWAQYSETELNADNAKSWCLEHWYGGGNTGFYRGNDQGNGGIDYIGTADRSTLLGWRPVLELVPPQ